MVVEAQRFYFSDERRWNKERGCDEYEITDRKSGRACLTILVADEADDIWAEQFVAFLNRMDTAIPIVAPITKIRGAKA
jgi:hypothetical protein